MATTPDGLLADIAAGVHEDTTSLSSLLGKCVLLGKQAKSERLVEWARNELHGYDSEPPNYRQVPAQLHALVMDGRGANGFEQVLSSVELTEAIGDKAAWNTALLTQGVGELERLADGNEDSLVLLPWWGDAVKTYLDEVNSGQGLRVQRVAWRVPRATIRGVVVRIRTSLAELVAELDYLTPDDEAAPTTSTADSAVNLVIKGDGNQVTYNPQQASGGGSNTLNVSPTKEPVSEPNTFWQRLRRRGAVVAVATIIAAIVGILALLVAIFTWIGWNP
jgi:hypothetical protein